MERLNILHIHDKHRLERWIYRGPHIAFNEHLTFGTLPDGRWWIDATWERFNAWVYADEDEARTHFARLLSQPPPGEHVGTWELALAEHEPGVPPSRANVVPPGPLAGPGDSADAS